MGAEKGAVLGGVSTMLQSQKKAQDCPVAHCLLAKCLLHNTSAQRLVTCYWITLPSQTRKVWQAKGSELVMQHGVML